MTEPYVKSDEVWGIDKLIPYELNAKKHDEAQVAKIAASITRYGWTTRIVVEEDGSIIAGHGRRLAAIKLNCEKVPVTVVKGITKEQAKALRLIDNKVQEGGYDTELLSIDLRSLVVDDGIDLSEFFDKRDLDFAIDDLGDINLEALSSDIAPEVAAQTARTEAEIAAADEGDVSLTKALGISKITGEQARELKALMGEALDKTDFEAIEAVMEGLRHLIALQVTTDE